MHGVPGGRNYRYSKIINEEISLNIQLVNLVYFVLGKFFPTLILFDSWINSTPLYSVLCSGSPVSFYQYYYFILTKRSVQLSHLLLFQSKLISIFNIYRKFVNCWKVSAHLFFLNFPPCPDSYSRIDAKYIRNSGKILSAYGKATISWESRAHSFTFYLPHIWTQKGMCCTRIICRQSPPEIAFLPPILPPLLQF